MFDIGWSEMAIIMLVALIVIGPKDLPRMARTLGQWVAKGRSMAREFQRSLEDMAREAELDDVKREIEKVGRTDIKKSIEKTIDPTGDLGRAFDPKSSLSSSKPPAKTPGAAAANGEAKEPAASPAVSSGQPAKAAETEAAVAPKAAAGARTPARSSNDAKPRATQTKPKTQAKPKAAAKPRDPAKPGAKGKAPSGDSVKPAAQDRVVADP